MAFEASIINMQVFLLQNVLEHSFAFSDFFVLDFLILRNPNWSNSDFKSVSVSGIVILSAKEAWPRGSGSRLLAGWARVRTRSPCDFFASIMFYRLHPISNARHERTVWNVGIKGKGVFESRQMWTNAVSLRLRRNHNYYFQLNCLNYCSAANG